MGIEYGSPISRDSILVCETESREILEARFARLKRDQNSKVPILVENFSIFNQKLQLKMEIILLWFFISPNLTYMQRF